MLTDYADRGRPPPINPPARLAGRDPAVQDLVQAAAFMEAVRAEQRSSATALKGKSYLPVADRLDMMRFAARSSFVLAASGVLLSHDTVGRVCELFGEMCWRRRGDRIGTVQPSVIRLLVSELWINVIVTSARPRDLVRVTAYQGAIAPQLIREYQFMRGVKESVRRAMVRSPGDPSAVLERAASRTHDGDQERARAKVSHVGDTATVQPRHD